MIDHLDAVCRFLRKFNKRRERDGEREFEHSFAEMQKRSHKTSLEGNRASVAKDERRGAVGQ